MWILKELSKGRFSLSMPMGVSSAIVSLGMAKLNSTLVSAAMVV